MNVTIDERGGTAWDTDSDPEWRRVVADAALAAGVDDLLAHVEASGPGTGTPDIGPPDPSEDGPESSGAPVVCDRHVPLRVTSAAAGTEPRRAELRGALLDSERVHAVSGSADVDRRELRLTCQAGRFHVHDQAHAEFPTGTTTPTGTYNRARAGLEARVPPGALRGSTGGRVVANVLVPVAYENTLQRIWRLAVPSRNDLLRQGGRHLAVAGIRGGVVLQVRHAGRTTAACRDFVRRARSAHAPNDVRGFGPVRGPIVLEVESPELNPSEELEISVSVVVRAALAGDPGAYRPEAPFYAGIDLGGGGSVRMPQHCLSDFDIPLTPLIGNEPVTLLTLGFLAHG